MTTYIKTHHVHEHGNSATRTITLHLLKISNMTTDGNIIVFCITDLVKQTSTRIKPPVIRLIPYQGDTSLCVTTTLNDYIARSSKFRQQQDQLLLSFSRPHRAVTKDTISRWIKLVLESAGINILNYKPHSTRSASTSATMKKRISVDEILKTAGWSNEITFAKYYDKPISNDTAFSNALLKTVTLSNTPDGL